MQHNFQQVEALLADQGWTVLASSHGAITPTSWKGANRKTLMDGTIHAGRQGENGVLALFAFYYNGGNITVPDTAITGVSRAGRLLNSAVEVQYLDDIGSRVLTLVGPAGRMKDIFAALNRRI